MAKKGIYLLTAGTALVALAGLGWKASSVTAQPAPAAMEAPKPRTARVAVAEAGPGLKLPVTAAPQQEAAIHARLSGFIAERRVEIGDRVTADQVLARIDAPEMVRAGQRLKAALAEAEARMVLANANLRRAAQLVEQGHVSRSVLDERQAEADSAIAARAATAAELAQVEEQLAFREVRAPFDGVVVERLVERGDLVAADQPGSSSTLFRIARIDRLRIVIDAPQSAVRQLVPGGALSVSFPEFPGDRFPATIARSAGLIDRTTGTMRVEAEMDNQAGRIPAGMAGSVELAGAAAEGLRLPLAALVTREGRPHVAALREGRVSFRPVQLGRNLGPQVEILGGVQAGEEVILNPNGLLIEGGSPQ